MTEQLKQILATGPKSMQEIIHALGETCTPALTGRMRRALRKLGASETGKTRGKKWALGETAAVE